MAGRCGVKSCCSLSTLTCVCFSPPWQYARRLLSATRPRCGDVTRCPGHAAPSWHCAEPGGGREEQGSFSSLIPDQSTPGSRAAWACGQGEILHPPPFLQCRVRVYVQTSSREAQGHGAPDMPGKVPLPAAGLDQLCPSLSGSPAAWWFPNSPSLPQVDPRRNFPPEQACLAPSHGEAAPSLCSRICLGRHPGSPAAPAWQRAGLPLPQGQSLSKSFQAPSTPKFTLHHFF